MLLFFSISLLFFFFFCFFFFFFFLFGFDIITSLEKEDGIGEKRERERFWQIKSPADIQSGILMTPEMLILYYTILLAKTSISGNSMQITYTSVAISKAK